MSNQNHQASEPLRVGWKFFFSLMVVMLLFGGGVIAFHAYADSQSLTTWERVRLVAELTGFVVLTAVAAGVLVFLYWALFTSEGSGTTPASVKPAAVVVKQVATQGEPPRPKGLPGVIHLPGALSPVPGTFQTDECMPNATVERLRAHGLDVVTTKEAGLREAEDWQQLEAARNARRILITYDKGFIRLHESGVKHAGIVHSPVGKVWDQEIVRLCLKLAQGAAV